MDRGVWWATVHGVVKPDSISFLSKFLKSCYKEVTKEPVKSSVDMKERTHSEMLPSYPCSQNT